MVVFRGMVLTVERRKLLKFLPSSTILKPLKCSLRFKRIFPLALLKYQIIFLALASSGLRVSELLGANIDHANRMLIPKTHNGTTKNAWVSFYDDETEKLLKAYQGNPFENSRNTVTHVFKKVARKTGIKINPHIPPCLFFWLFN